MEKREDNEKRGGIRRGERSGDEDGEDEEQKTPHFGRRLPANVVQQQRQQKICVDAVRGMEQSCVWLKKKEGRTDGRAGIVATPTQETGSAQSPGVVAYLWSLAE